MMKSNLVLIGCLAAATLAAQTKIVPAPIPPVIFRPQVIRADEKPVIFETKREIASENGLVQRVETTITFTNPNARDFEGELEFPLPDGATVCGYALEVNGTMVPGVVCEKETARVAFENERKRTIDPGVVEHVKGNVWKTRIYPLRPSTPRKARIAYICEIKEKTTVETVVEKDGDEVFVGHRRPGVPTRRADRLRQAHQATLYWDASFSRQGKVATDRNLLECLPEKGNWTLIVFRNVIEKPLAFTERAALLKAIDGLVYDGGTCLEAIDRVAMTATNSFIFTDERDEDSAALNTVEVRRLSPQEKPPAEPKAGRLLATLWATRRVTSLSAAADQNKKELLDLGRRYSIASPTTSLLVLETLDQYLRYKVEPPAELPFAAEWKRRRAATDDPIAAAREKTEFLQQLLRLWEERVTWWNNPVPKKATPHSGLFGGLFSRSERRAANAEADVVGAIAEESRASVSRDPDGMTYTSGNRYLSTSRAAPRARAEVDALTVRSPMRSAKAKSPASPTAATVTLAAWDPKTPYLTALNEAAKGEAYSTYLRQREIYSQSPAFFLDCAGWFFKAKEQLLAVRIISNLTEMKLEDAGLWRTRGWRLREAGAADEAVETFAHVLKMRGEEPQSRRDLALVLAERGKARFARGERAGAASDLAEAMRLLHETAFKPTARRSGRRGNDMQTSVLALEELNGLLTWSAAQAWQGTPPPQAPEMDAAYRRDLPLDLRIVLSWDTDETDVDLHVLEPDGEEAFYRHRRTSSGAFLSEDVTTGYGPEEYLHKTAPKGAYKILAHYFASHRQALTGPAVVTATVYTGWGRENEKRNVLSFRLDKPKDKQPIGEIKIGD